MSRNRGARIGLALQEQVGVPGVLGKDRPKARRSSRSHALVVALGVPEFR
jgi:hypothetical protein